MNVDAVLASMVAEETAAPIAEPTILDDAEYPTARDLLTVADPYAMVGEYLEGVRSADGELAAYDEAKRLLWRVLLAARTSRRA